MSEPERRRAPWSRLRALGRTSAFQLTVFYSILFTLSVAVLSLVLYWQTIGLLLRENDATLKAEVTGLAEQYAEHGLDRLVQVIVNRIRNDTAGDMLYLFASRDLDPLAGNLRDWPPLEPDADGWVEFEHRRPDGRVVPARARVYALRDGLHLLVGRNVEQLQQLQHIFNRALLVGGGVAVLLAMVGGTLMSSRLTRRVGEVSAATADIMAGHLDRRLEVSGSGDEFDELALRINLMLERLEAMMAAVRHVSDNIAHDLRTPLTRLRNRLELSLRASPETQRTEIEAAVADADGLLATFAALLRIARIEGGGYDAELGVVDLSALAADAADLYAEPAAEQGLAFTTAIASALYVRGERNLLFQALANLLDNAIKYTSAGGTVALDLRAADVGVTIEVRDSGPGIAPADRARVTGRFVRLDQSRNAPGAGLGLALVKAVVELHRGALAFEDAAPGLRVRLELPRSDAPVAPA